MSIEKKFGKVKKEVGPKAPDFEKIKMEKELADAKEELAETRANLSRVQRTLQVVLKDSHEQAQKLEEENREYREAARHNKELAATDKLTGLLNLRGFEEDAKILLNAAPRARNEQSTGAMEVSFNIAFIDLNDFKPINDKYGHAAGDIALKRAADALRSAVRSGDLVGRKGGDEFVVAFLGTEGDKKDTMGMNRYIIAERIRRALLNTGFTYTGKDEAGNPLSPVEIPSITASIGVVKAKPGESLNDVIHGADVRVYEAKAVKEKAKKEYDAKSEEERAKEKPPSQSYLSVEGLEGVV